MNSYIVNYYLNECSNFDYKCDLSCLIYTEENCELCSFTDSKICISVNEVYSILR